MRFGLVRFLSAGGILLALMASKADALTATAQFNVTATVLGNCAVSATDLAFGNYSANSATPLPATSTLSVTCTSGTTYTVALDGGTNKASVTGRAMTDGATHNLNYALYTTNAYTSIWGDGTASTVTQAGTGSGSAQTLTVYGRIPVSQFVTAGSYSDRITVTVTY
ncbi:MAG TPA: spore coat U domain-containing protein [Rhizomicrobium sp.]